jgi:hypothetical protein
MLKKSNFNIRNLENDINVLENDITDYRVEHPNPLPLLYQSGYLTIKSYDKEFNVYGLGFPNNEVKIGFLDSLIKVYLFAPDVQNGVFVKNLVDDMRAGNVDNFMTRLQSIIASAPSNVNERTESYYHMSLYLIFKLCGFYVDAEVSSIKGRCDVVVNLQEFVYVFEFKLLGNSTAEKALKQIDDKGYSIPYQATGKKIIKIGVEFDPKKRTIGRWLVADKNKKIAKKITKKVSKKVIKKVTKKVSPKTSKKVIKKSSGKKN